jgi:phage shock protein A
MSLGIFGKVSLLVKAETHSVLDKQIDAHSVEAHEQLLRELEAAMQAESTESIRAGVTAKNLHLQIAEIQTHIDEYQAGINRILTKPDHNDDDVTTMTEHMMELENEIESIKSQETAANENCRILTETLKQLKDRHKVMMDELQQLRAAKSQNAADSRALEAVRKAKDLTEGVDSVHLGGALAAAKQQSEVTREELRQAVGNIQSTPEALLQKSKVQQRIDEMRAKLQAGN